MKSNSSLFLSLLWFSGGVGMLGGGSLTGEPGEDTTKPVFMSDLEADPSKAGWAGTEVWGSAKFAAEWTTAEAHSGKRSMRISGGLWSSPKFKVKPLNFYRMTFASKAESKGYWVMQFFDSRGLEIAADDYSSVEVSEQWLKNSFYVMAHADAAFASLGFRPIKSDFLIDDIAVTPISRQTALEFADNLYETLSPVNFEPEDGRFKRLNVTIEKLRAGKELTVVVLGDSIANDMANSRFHLQVERNYPGSRIRFIHSVRGITGCWYYERDNHVESYILDYKPDLVIIAGISHRLNDKAIRNVIRQTRIKLPAVEFLVMTGAIMEPGMNRNWAAKGMASPPTAEREKAVLKEAEFYSRLRASSEVDDFATLDMRSLWEEYLKQSGKPRTWFQRDFVHANERGKQIMGRIAVRFFEHKEDK